MNYSRESLAPDEKLVYTTHPHWIVFGPALSVLLLSLWVFFYLPQFFMISQPAVQKFFASFIALIGLWSIARALLVYTTTEYAITNKRMIMKKGFIRRLSTEIFLSRIEGINIRQTIMGRILHYGTVIIVGTGGTNDFCSNVPDPVAFRRLLQQQFA